MVGQLVNASNATLVVEIDQNRFVYKPITGERPLWDFLDGTLALRERAAYVLSETLGLDLVPETILAEVLTDLVVYKVGLPQMLKLPISLVLIKYPRIG